MLDQLNVHTSDGMEFSLDVAGIGSRSYAFVIDWHIRLILALAWWVLLWLILTNADIERLIDSFHSDSSWIGTIIMVPPLMIYLLYHPVLELIMHGRTPGKRMAGVRIVTSDGYTPSAGALLIRNIFRLVDSLPVFYGIGFVAALITANQVRIGDMAAGTLLVYEQKIDANTLTRTSHLLNSSLEPQDQELLLDLLERWQGLSKTARIDLGLAFLKRIQIELPTDKPRQPMDDKIHQHLRKIVGE